jgi:hypothetical protein
MAQASYWNNNGTYEAFATKLRELVPVEGPITAPKSRALEKFRKASNCYYDLFNNGLCNRAVEFRQVFGFGGTVIVKSHYTDVSGLERKMDEIILKAALEQGLV